jgi:fatty acid-binding protein DegV
MKKSISQIVAEFGNYTLNQNYNKVIIGHSDNLEMASALHDKLLTEHGIDAEIRMIGPVIGSHLGPNAVAYIFMSNEERPM